MSRNAVRLLQDKAFRTRIEQMMRDNQEVLERLAK
jgi:hypothetical protein